MKIRPLGNRIVVRPDEFQETTASGILITAAQDKATDTGMVVAVGPEVSGINQEDEILFVKDTGNKIELEGETLVTLTVEEVVGLVNQDLEPVADVIVCVDADFGDQETQAGIIIKSNLAESQGITSRWMQVYKVGPEQTTVQPGQWVLVEYGRWTSAFSVDGHDEAYRVDPEACLAVADEKPETFYYNSDTITASRKALY